MGLHGEFVWVCSEDLTNMTRIVRVVKAGIVTNGVCVKPFDICNASVLWTSLPSLLALRYG